MKDEAGYLCDSCGEEIVVPAYSACSRGSSPRHQETLHGIKIVAKGRSSLLGQMVGRLRATIYEGFLGPDVLSLF